VGYAGFGCGVGLCRRRADMLHVGLTRPHLARTALLRHGGQESSPPHLYSNNRSYHGGPGATALVPAA